ncbi:MAG: GNAT family N-acetyltransferase [Lachnospiraceae bacterium]|nr:GNAT family N-acetyltransferase [Lachnospiraceae bacterium]
MKLSEQYIAHGICYRTLQVNEICRELFRDFIRRQNVEKCLRKENGAWVIRDAPFIDDWTENDYQFLIQCLRNTIQTGGLVCGAFHGDAHSSTLKGFVSVESALFGGAHGYLDLSCIHVSEDMRGSGIGKILFGTAKDWAKKKGGKKLYISSHSAIETQAFYKAMGCVDAQEYDQRHVAQEPYDRQLECVL